MEWNGFESYLAKRSSSILEILLEWIFWYLDMSPGVLATLDKIHS